MRRRGRKIRIRARPGTEGFAQAYADALQSIDGAEDKKTVKGAAAGTLGWLASCYFSSSEFRGLDERSRRTRRGVIESCLREPRKPGLADLLRDCPVSVITPAHIKMLRDRKAGPSPARPTIGGNSVLHVRLGD